jgi:hypothetical protein
MLGLCLVAVFAASAVAAAGAQARYVPAEHEVFGETGSGPGQFSHPFGVAVQASNGNVLVADGFNERVQSFATGAGGSATFLSQFTGAGTPSPGFSEHPWGVAVDNSGGAHAGDVYVAVYEGEEGLVSPVDRFRPKVLEPNEYEYECQLTGPGKGCLPNPAGEGGVSAEPFERTRGVAVDASGDLYIATTAGGVYELPAGATEVLGLLHEFGGFDGVAVAGNDVYALRRSSNEVLKLEVEPATATVLNKSLFAMGLSLRAVAVSPSSGDVFVAEGYGEGKEPHVDVYSSAGTPIETFGEGEFIGEPYGIAYSPFNKDVYVTDERNVVHVFEESSLPAPVVTSIEPSSGPTHSETEVKIMGSGFVEGARVLIGGREASGVVVVSETEITAKTPTGAAGEAEVVVRDRGGRSTGGPKYTYIPESYPLTVTVTPVGDGTVQCNTGGGPEACAPEYAEGTSVELIENPSSGYRFDDWSEACSGSGATCDVTMNGPQSVTATFTFNVLPKYKTCVKAPKVNNKYTGRYTNKGCTTEATKPEQEAGKKNKYEREAATAGIKFTSKSKATTLVTHSTTGTPERIVCKKDKNTGEITNASVDSEKITFEKCVGNGEKTNRCENVGKEKIETETLTSELGYLPGGKIGVRLSNAAAPHDFAKFKCGTETVELDGSLVGAIENAKKGETITFALNGGEQGLKTIGPEGAESGPYNLYTESDVESTLAGTEAQTGPGAY